MENFILTGECNVFSYRSIILILLSMSFFFICPLTSFAWSCGNSLEPKDLFKRHDSVFIGEVLGTSNENIGALYPKSRVTFEVKSLLKGNHKDTLIVVTTAGSVFLEGGEYLVYAYQTTQDNYLYRYEEGELATDTICGGTKELSLADDDLEQIADAKRLDAVLRGSAVSAAILAMIIFFIILTKRKGRPN
jgi:hypothetical protein